MLFIQRDSIYAELTYIYVYLWFRNTGKPKIDTQPARGGGSGDEIDPDPTIEQITDPIPSPKKLLNRIRPEKSS